MTNNGGHDHYTSGALTNHFFGVCDECDAHYLSRMTLAHVEHWYRQGVIGQDAYEAYRWVWATNLAHEGYAPAAGWRTPPVTERARGIGERLREIIDAR